MFKRFMDDMKKYWKYAVYSSRAQLKSEIANSYLNWLWWILDVYKRQDIRKSVFTGKKLLTKKQSMLQNSLSFLVKL